MDRANGSTVNSSRFNLAGGMRIPEPRIRAKPHCALAHKEYDDGMNTLLGAVAVSGGGLVTVLITLIVVGLICGLLWWLIGYCGLPAPFDKLCRVVVALIAVIFICNCLLGLTGHAFITW